MKVDYAGIIKKSFKFSYGIKRWIPFYLMDAALAAVILILFLGNATDLLNLVTDPENMVSAGNLANALMIFFVAMIVWAAARLWATGALVHQSLKEKEFDKSWKVSKGKMLPMLIAFVLTGILGFLVGLIPTVGWLIGIVFSLIFFFITQAIIIDNNGAVESIKKSWHIFRKSPFDVFVVWLVIVVVSMAVVVAFALPLIASFMGSIIASGAMDVTTNPEAFALLIMVIQKNLFVTVALGLVALIGLEISYAFSIKAQTEFYQQAKKK